MNEGKRGEEDGKNETGKCIVEGEGVIKGRLWGT